MTLVQDGEELRIETIKDQINEVPGPHPGGKGNGVKLL